MAPVEVCQYIDDSVPNPLVLKNTFLHFPADSELDNDWIIRRQASDPAPKRQISVPADRLEKFEEAEGESDSDLDLDNPPSGLFRQVSILRTQPNMDLPENSDMDRQISSLSMKGFDKQVSAAGFCRQETEQQWPTYATPLKVAINAENVTSNSSRGYVDETVLPTAPAPTKEDDSFQRSSAAQVLPLEELLSPSSVNMNMNSMAWAMNPVMWPQPCTMDDYVDTKSPISAQPYKNRRKARSLITLAQEQQRRQQSKLVWSPSHFEHVPQMQQVAPSDQKMLASEVPPAQQAQQPKSAAQFCPYCGGKVEQRFKFCQYCGTNVSSLWDT